MSGYTAVQVSRPSTGVVLTAEPQLIPTAGRHSAFPGVAKAPDGSLVMVRRDGTDHADTRDGSIVLAVSWDQGLTWANHTTVLSGRDYRDPSISYIDGSRFLTYFTGSASNSAEGAYVIRDNSAPVRIDPGFPKAAISAPIVRLPDGRLGAAFYAQLAGESRWTAWMGWSADGGTSWTVNRIANSIGAGIDHVEPWLTVDGDRVHFTYRHGVQDALAIRTSTNSGASGWDQPRIIRYNASGRPTVLRMQSGTLVLVYRHLPTKSAQIAYSLDRGWTWYDSTQMMPSPSGSPNGMTYAAGVEVSRGVSWWGVSMEQPDGSADLFGTNIAESVK